MIKHFNSEGTKNINADFKEILKENQVLKKALAYQEEKLNGLENWKKGAEENLYRLNNIIAELKKNE